MLDGYRFPVFQASGYMTSPTNPRQRLGTISGMSAGGIGSGGIRQTTPWSAEAYLSGRGLPTVTPSGEYLGGARTLSDLARSVEKSYGTNFGQWASMPSEERTAMFNRLNTMRTNEIFDPETGLPTRTPRTPQEAQQFQLEATRRARLMQQSQLRQALSTLQEGVGLAREDLAAREAGRTRSLATLRYGLGMTQRSSPYSLATMMSPLLAQQARTHMEMPQQLARETQPYLQGQAAARMSMQYEPGDYSYFLRPGAQGGGGQMPYWATSRSRTGGAL